MIHTTEVIKYVGQTICADVVIMTARLKMTRVSFRQQQEEKANVSDNSVLPSRKVKRIGKANVSDNSVLPSRKVKKIEMDIEVSSAINFDSANKKRKAGQGTETANFNNNSRIIPRAPRVTRDGKVAVIYQPHQGLGWYSEHRIEALLFAPEIVDMIENDVSGSEVYEYCQKMNYGWSVMDTICYGLSIKWVPVSEEFRIHDSDGRETVVMKSTDQWFRA